MIYTTSRMTGSRANGLRSLLAVLAIVALALSPGSGWADESDEAAIILAQLEDLPSFDDSPMAEALAAPGELLEPGASDDLTDSATDDAAKIDMSTEEELLDLEEAIPMCTTGEVYDGGLWYTKFDFVYLYRQPLRDEFGIANDLADPEDDANLRTDHLKLRWRPGTRITIGRELGVDNLSRDQSIEFTFMGLFEWQQSSSLRGFNGGASIRNSLMSLFANANTVSAEYGASLNSYELNFRMKPRLGPDRLLMAHDGTWSRQCTPGLRQSYLGGLRIIQYKEDFAVRSSRTEAGSGYESIQATETVNNLFGIQGGIELTHQDCRWNWGFRTKAMALINAADRNRRDYVRFEDGTTSEFLQGGEDNQLAIGVEMGFSAAYQLHPKVAATIAYDAMWLHGVAQAADGIEEFGFGLDDDIDANENAIFHGLSLGLEMRW